MSVNKKDEKNNRVQLRSGINSSSFVLVTYRLVNFCVFESKKNERNTKHDGLPPKEQNKKKMWRVMQWILYHWGCLVGNRCVCP